MVAGERPPHIVVVGSTMIDVLSYAKRIPEQGQTVVGQRLQIGPGGKGANQAVMAARLGARVTFVSRIGTDALGDMAHRNLVERGLPVDRVRALATEPTGVASVWVEPDGHNRILVVPGANLRLTAADVSADLAGIPSPDCVMSQLEIPVEAVTEALRLGRASGAVTILNPAPAAALATDLLALVDWLTPNESEFETMFGAPPSDAALINAADRLSGGLIVTLGARGAATVIDGSVRRIEPRPVEALDTTGAGDAFMGALAFSLARGEALLDAIELANRCGALSAAAFGTQTSFPTADKVLAATG